MIPKKSVRAISPKKRSSGGKKSTGKLVTNVTSKSRISEVVYQTTEGLYEAGAIDQTTMRQFDQLCLPKIPNYTPAQIKAIRTRCKTSQNVLANHLNVSPSTLQKWETGARKPDGLALKVLYLIDKKGLQILTV